MYWTRQNLKDSENKQSILQFGQYLAPLRYFSGHWISASGMKLNPAKEAVIKVWLVPRSVYEMWNVLQKAAMAGGWCTASGRGSDSALISSMW
jgi:hypothetical protein